MPQEERCSSVDTTLLRALRLGGPFPTPVRGEKGGCEELEMRERWVSLSDTPEQAPLAAGVLTNGNVRRRTRWGTPKGATCQASQPTSVLWVLKAPADFRKRSLGSLIQHV